MRTMMSVAALLLAASALPSQAFAQRVPFARAIDVTAAATLDVSTIRGKIEVVAGGDGRIVVEGTATVRVGWDVPADALAIAKQVAAAPPIDQAGASVRLHEPESREAQRAVSVSYRVQAPAGTTVTSASESGETVIRGITGAVRVRTQSGAIDLQALGGAVQVATGSGAVTAADVAGPLSVTSASSAIAASRVGSSFQARTQSGEVTAEMTAGGEVDVETGSGAVRIHGVGGGLAVTTRSGRVTVTGATGAPGGEWRVTTSSSSVSLDVDGNAGFVVDAESRSGSVTVTGVDVVGTLGKRAASGTVGGGGPAVRIRTGSGAIRIQGAR